MRFAAVLVLSLACGVSACADRAEPPPARLEDWADRYRLADVSGRARLEAEGVALADARRAELLRLIEVDPAAAAARRLPFHLYRDLPSAVTAKLEEPLDAAVRFDVLIADYPDGTHDVLRFVELADGRRLPATVFGRRLEITSKDRLNAHGLVVDGRVVLTDSPIRELEYGELPAPEKPLLGREACAERDGRLLDLGDRVQRVCSKADEEVLVRRLLAEEQRIGADSDPQALSWTNGHKRVLIIRVDFEDMPGESMDVTKAHAMVASAHQHVHDSSYGRASLSGIVTPLYRLPQLASFYGSNYQDLLDDAYDAALADGYRKEDFELYAVCFKKISAFSWAGLGNLGRAGTWLNGATGGFTLAHELGHNFGLGHARMRETTGDTIIGAGQVIEYGDLFDFMGGGGHQVNACSKHRLEWLEDRAALDVRQSGLYRLFDVEVPLSNGLQALRIFKDSDRNYWLEYRPSSVYSELAVGPLVRFGLTNGNTTELLDMTPWTKSSSVNTRDVTLRMGRTWSDPWSDVHITSVGQGGTTPESIDVYVHLGSNPGAAPALTVSASPLTAPLFSDVTFTATAVDPDGDPLAYWWDFGDGKEGPNAAVVTHAFTRAGRFSVRCTVSDMKGGVTTRTVLVTVGNGGTGVSLIGTVRENGQPLEGVRVTTGDANAWTDSDGRFELTNVWPGTTGLQAIKPGYTFAPVGFTVPFAVGSTDVTGLDFNASRVQFTVRGTVNGVGMPAEGVTVKAGSAESRTNERGEFVLGPLSPGNVAVIASVTWERSFAPLNFTNPVAVTGDVTGLQFQETSFRVTGRIVGASAPVTVTNGLQRTVTYPGAGGEWLYSLQVPGGVWNLWVEGSGYVFTPSFDNPVGVIADVSGLDFVAEPGSGVTLQGHIRKGGEPLVGARMVAGTRTGMTDSVGRWVITGVPDGPTQLVPSSGAYYFQPVKRNVFVAGADVENLDFVALAGNEPPFVVRPATAETVSVMTDRVGLSVLGGDDRGEDQLTYTWEEIGGKGVGFPLNGTNTAKVLDAVFTRPGEYEFKVVIADAQGGKATSKTGTVTVQPTLTSLAMSPAVVRMGLGETVQFMVSGRDQFGTAYPTVPAITWTASGGGELSQDGRFRAQAQGTWTIEARTSAGVVGTAEVTVVAAPVITSLIAEAAVVGQPARMEAKATDDGGAEALVYTWSVLSGPGVPSFEPNGSPQAAVTEAHFDIPGSYVITVSVRDAEGNEGHGSTLVEVGEAASGCGCATGAGSGGLPAVVLLLVAWGARRARRHADQLGAPDELRS